MTPRLALPISERFCAQVLGFQGSEVGGSESNREIVSFRSCVRTRGVHCLVGMSPKVMPMFSLFPFCPGGFPFSLESNVKSSPLPPILLSSFGWLYRYVAGRIYLPGQVWTDHFVWFVFFFFINHTFRVTTASFDGILMASDIIFDMKSGQRKL